ncbi:MAG: ComEC/Rec2 family competence protein [Deltaproteobacteria bacterium]|nr:ComEC/Rec2 family competence protein [Deltaproteobacteria bacterium]
MDTANRQLKTENPPFSRPLTPVVLALMAGIAAPAWGLNLPARWLPAVLLLLWLALGAVWLARRPARLLPLIFFWLLGAAFCQQALQPTFPPHHLVHLPPGQELTILGRLDHPGKLAPERVQLFLTARAWLSPQGWRPAAGRLLVAAPNLAHPPVGADLVVKGRLRAPGSLKNPGTFDRPRFLAADGIFRELRLKDRTALVFLAEDAGYPLGERLRGGIRQLLKSLDPALRAIYLSMLLGDQGEVTPEMRHNLARTGTSHLLVVNGLHLGMVAAVIFFLSSWLMRRSAWLLLRLNVVKVATLMAAAAVVGYAWVAGGSPSTQRAEVMVLAYLLLVFLGRPREVWSALALAALIILSFTPLRLFSISLQLSFAAVAGLIFLMPRLLRIDGSVFDREFQPGLGWKLYLRVKDLAAASAVATLATAPLVAAYFQVVSLLGIVVNLVAIPLVLLLALPLGEAAVFAQAIHLTPLAQGLLFLGQWPLWLGWQAVCLGASLPGSAFIVPIPTWLQIALYFLVLILIFAPRRHLWTWAGAGLAGVALIVSVAAPMIAAPRTLEITCLDTYGGLSGVVVSPEGRRLAVSAPRRSWPGRQAGGPGTLPAYCHWRQWRTLDQLLALSLSQENAAELLTLAQQFTVAGYWYGRRGYPGPALWDLWNYLGDRGCLPLPLEPWRRGPQPPAGLGSAALKYLKLGQDQGFALQVTGQGRRALILPPGRDLELPPQFEPSATGLDLLVLPAGPVGSPGGLPPSLARLQPRLLIVYGGDPGATGPETGIPCHFTRDGAVSVYLGDDGVRVRQWRH